MLVSLSYRKIHHINFVSPKQLFQTCKDKRCVLSRFSPVQLCVILWTIVPQAPLSMGFSRQEYWSGFLFPSPGKCSKPLSSKPLCILVIHGYLIYWTWACLESEIIDDFWNILRSYLYPFCVAAVNHSGLRNQVCERC